MSGINPIDMIRYGALISPYRDKLTPSTRAKLIALGVDVSNIKTETEGKTKLMEALSDRLTYERKPELKLNKNDKLLEEARDLADKLDISVHDNDTVNDIIEAINIKVDELKAEAGEDFDKQAYASSYEKELSLLEKSHNSMIDLSASMNLTANMNVAFHGLY